MVADAGTGAYASICELHGGANAAGGAGGKAVYAEYGLRVHAGDECLGHLHRLYACDAQYARGNGADVAHALIRKARKLLEHVARDKRAVHGLRAEGIGRNAAVAQAHHQYRRLAFAMEHAGDLLA